MIAAAAPYASLSTARIHDLFRLRQDVFVVEQACAYADLDGRDAEPGTRHVVLVDGDVETGRLLGCARVLDDGDVWRIGRVALRVEARGRGLADAVMHAAMSVSQGRDVVLDAQTPLADWYAGLGFSIDGPEFVEDGIAHVPMRLSR